MSKKTLSGWFLLEAGFPYAAWGFLFILKSFDSPSAWFLKCLSGAVLIFLSPGYHLSAAFIDQSQTSYRSERLFLGIIINFFFLAAAVTAVKFFFGSLTFLHLVTVWVPASFSGTIIWLWQTTGKEETDPGCKTKAVAFLVIAALTIAALIFSPSVLVDEEHWFSDKFVNADFLKKTVFSSDPMMKLTCREGCRQETPDSFLISSPTVRFTLKNASSQTSPFSLRFIFRNGDRRPVDLSLAVNAEMMGTYRIQGNYDIRNHGYGYPPSNLVIDRILTVPPGETEIIWQFSLPDASPFAPDRLALFDLSNRTLSQARKIFARNFIYGDVADEREMLNLARDLNSHLFMFQRYYNDEFGAPGVVLSPEGERGGPYWNNFPMKPFIDSIALVLAENSARTVTLLAVLTTMLLFLSIVSATDMLRLELRSGAPFVLALFVFAYFCFVRPGVETNTRQAIQDLFLVLSFTYMIRGNLVRFIAAAVLFMLTNFTGFGLLMFALIFKLFTDKKRSSVLLCLLGVISLQILLNVYLTWIFSRAGRLDYWAKIQSEWGNRFTWLWEILRNADIPAIKAQAVMRLRVMVWLFAATILLPFAWSWKKFRSLPVLKATILFYSVIILLMEKPRGHYISSIIALSALETAPLGTEVFTGTKKRRLLLAIVLLICLILCLYHARLYIFTEDYVPPIFPPNGLLERLLYWI